MPINIFSEDIINTPMYINAADVAQSGTSCAIGLKNIAIKKNIPTKIAVYSVFPPSAIPVADSIFLGFYKVV